MKRSLSTMAILCLVTMWASSQINPQNQNQAASMASQRNVQTATAPVLSLTDAEEHALKHQPRLVAQIFRERAAYEAITESKSTYFPQLVGNLTAVQANGDTAVAAGAVTTSSVSTRAAGGISLVQLITDFGRTNERVRSAQLSAQASGQSTEGVRQQILRKCAAGCTSSSVLSPNIAPTA
jgi:outer membrane protein TolC